MKELSKLSTRLKNNDISRQIARLEKEFEFWGKMYSKETAMITGTALQQVEQLESALEIYREVYRKELQKDLGRDFSVEPLDTRNSYDPLRHYFFPMEYQKKFAGIILPFTKMKKAVFNPRIKDNKHASEVLHSKGYRIKKIVSGYNRNEAYLLPLDEEDIKLGLSGKDMI